MRRLSCRMMKSKMHNYPKIVKELLLRFIELDNEEKNKIFPSPT
jgi:hypothetical protein